MKGARRDGTPKNYTVTKSGFLIPEGRRFRNQDMAARFMFRKLGITCERDDETGCYKWPLAVREPNGYPLLYWDGTVQPVARWLAIQLRRSALPSNLCLSHKFGWPELRNCVRPSHYELVTKSENIRRTKALYGRIRFKTSKKWSPQRVRQLQDIAA